MKHLRPCAVCREPVARPAVTCARCVAPDASAYAPVAEMSGRTVSIAVAAIAVVMALYNIANWSL